MPLSPRDYEVLLLPRAYARITGYSARYANDQLDEKRWMEVYGLLVGHVNNASASIKPDGEFTPPLVLGAGRRDPLVVVTDAIPMVVGSRAGVKFENRQYVDAATIDERLYSLATTRGGPRQSFIVGWFHTHPGFSFFFSEVDTLTHLGYQSANPHAIGVIFDHTRLTSFDPGVEVLRLDSPDAGLMAQYEFVGFNLPDAEREIQRAQFVKRRILAKQKELRSLLNHLATELTKKRMAQLQRNYGLLMVPKYLSKDAQRELAGEDDEDLWEWNERVLAAKYRVPKFRRKVEELLATEAGSNPRKRLRQLTAVKERLANARSRWQETWDDFSRVLNDLANWWWYLDTRERQVVEHLEGRLRSYRNVLDDLEVRVNFSMAATKEVVTRAWE
ncbi:MAG: hypothetical protein Kow0069_22690 [Promethearchaeota archaeon]